MHHYAFRYSFGPQNYPTLDWGACNPDRVGFSIENELVNTFVVDLEDIILRKMLVHTSSNFI